MEPSKAGDDSPNNPMLTQPGEKQESAKNHEEKHWCRLNKLKLIAVVVGVTVLIGVAVGLTIYFVTQKDDDTSSTAAEKQHKDYGIGGDCWLGHECDLCNTGYEGIINGVKVCCANCKRSGLRMSSDSCDCLHNGPD